MQGQSLDVDQQVDTGLQNLVRVALLRHLLQCTTLHPLLEDHEGSFGQGDAVILQSSIAYGADPLLFENLPPSFFIDLFTALILEEVDYFIGVEVEHSSLIQRTPTQFSKEGVFETFYSLIHTRF